MSLVDAYLEANSVRLGLEARGLTGRRALLLVTSRFVTARHVVTLVLPQGRASSALVAKVPRLAADAPLVEREAANLRAAAVARPDWDGAIPRVLACETFRDYPILLETALPGTLLGWPDLRHAPSRWVDAALAWLLGPNGGAVMQPADPGWYERLVGEPLRLLVSSLPADTEVHELTGRTLELLSPLRGAALPLTFEHGDLNCPNLMSLPGRRLGVVDWEAAEPHGLPACDLLFLLAYVTFARARARHPARQVAAFDRAFLGPDPWIRGPLLDYARRIELDPALLPVLVVACFARQSARLARRSLELEPRSEERLSWLLRNRHLALWRCALVAAESAGIG